MKRSSVASGTPAFELVWPLAYGKPSSPGAARLLQQARAGLVGLNEIRAPVVFSGGQFVDFLPHLPGRVPLKPCESRHRKPADEAAVWNIARMRSGPRPAPAP